VCRRRYPVIVLCESVLLSLDYFLFRMNPIKNHLSYVTLSNRHSREYRNNSSIAQKQNQGLCYLY